VLPTSGRPTWLPQEAAAYTAWSDAIHQTTGEKYSSFTVTRAINTIIDNEQSKFTHNRSEFEIHQNRRKLDIGGGKKGHVHFYWVQPLNVASIPPYPAETDLWQRRYDQYARRFEKRTQQKRSDNNPRSSSHPTRNLGTRTVKDKNKKETASNSHKRTST
jgi:hypothetical protein